MQRVHSLSAQIPVALPNPCRLRPETRVDWADADTCLLHFCRLGHPPRVHLRQAIGPWACLGLHEGGRRSRVACG